MINVCIQFWTQLVKRSLAQWESSTWGQERVSCLSTLWRIVRHLTNCLASTVRSSESKIVTSSQCWWWPIRQISSIKEWLFPYYTLINQPYSKNWSYYVKTRSHQKRVTRWPASSKCPTSSVRLNWGWTWTWHSTSWFVSSDVSRPLSARSHPARTSVKLANAARCACSFKLKKNL